MTGLLRERFYGSVPRMHFQPQMPEVRALRSGVDGGTKQKPTRVEPVTSAPFHKPARYCSIRGLLRAWKIYKLVGESLDPA